MENAMEPDEVVFQKSLETYMRHVINDPNAYKIVTTPSGYRHMDLSSVSTRDLLNECYRRRAIEKFTYDVSIDQYFLRQEPEAREYTMKDLKRGMWEVMLKNEKFVADAIQIIERQNNLQIRTEFQGEVYICKHPTKVRK
jgi:hypothetical protein